jgi:gamma-tubulin complex component 2
LLQDADSRVALVTKIAWERQQAESEPLQSAGPLKGLEAFTLSYRVRWPVSLVISKKTLTKYQLIFRHVFYCKHVEREVCDAWQHHQAAFLTKTNTASASMRSFGRSFGLRHRMLQFLQNFNYYMMAEVLEAHWHQLEERLVKASTIDEVLTHHNSFLDKCLSECLLTSKPLLRLLSKLLESCRLFAINIRRYSTLLPQPVLSKFDAKGKRQPGFQEKKAAEEFDAQVISLADQQQYVQMIERFVNTFDSKMQQFIDHLKEKATRNYEHHLNNLYTRLDYNSFYSTYFEKQAMTTPDQETQFSPNQR